MTPMKEGSKGIEKIYDNTKGDNLGATDVELKQWQKPHRSSHTSIG